MKPIKSESGCLPTSSNCVIYQGPCLDCINVNTGDTVSDVVHDLAVVLCELKEQLDLSDLDLACLIDCPSCPDPDKTLFNVLELIITKLCSIEPNPGPGPNPEEVVVNIATCFQYTDDNGDLITQMKVSDYAKAIGIKVCSLQTTIDQHTSTLANHETRIDILESEIGGGGEIPQITPSCVLPAIPTDIDIVLDALEDQFCTLRNTTGTSTALSQAVANQCAGLNSSNALSTSGTMSGIAGWKSTVSTVADSLTNLWITICDMRAAVADIKANCCSANCDSIVVDFLPTITDNGTILKIFFSGYTSIPSGFADCNISGSPLTITDGLGGVYTTNVLLPNASLDPDPIIIELADTPLNSSGNYNFVLSSCLTNGTLTCNKTVSKTATAVNSCGIPTNIIATINS